MIHLNKLYTNSRVAEVNAFTIRLIKLYKKGDWSKDAYLTNLFKDLEACSNSLTTAINPSKVVSLLEEKDEVRDDKVRSLHYFLTGLSYHPEQKIQLAAQALLEVYQRYGMAIISENYAVETALIASLIKDLSAQSLKSSIDALSGCAALIEGLHKAQEDFEKTRVEYEEEKAIESVRENATAIKYKALKLINEKLIPYLQAMSQVDEAKYGSFTHKLAEITQDNNETVKKRTNSK